MKIHLRKDVGDVSPEYFCVTSSLKATHALKLECIQRCNYKSITYMHFRGIFSLIKVLINNLYTFDASGDTLIFLVVHLKVMRSFFFLISYLEKI